MICYHHALKRHNATPIWSSPTTEAKWIEVEVGTPQFWNNLQHGQLIAYNPDDVYVGILDEYEWAMENGSMFLYLFPDPTKMPLPEGQETLPVQFGIRDKIMMETANG